MAGKVKLTEKKITILTVLKLRRAEIDGPVTSAELGEIVFRHQRVKHGARECAGSALRAMAKDGLVEALGTSSTNARCYAITPAGRAALSQQTGSGETGE